MGNVWLEEMLQIYPPLNDFKDAFFQAFNKKSFGGELFHYNILPSLKLTANLPLKIDAWKTILSFWDASLSGAMLASGRV